MIPYGLACVAGSIVGAQNDVWATELLKASVRSCVENGEEDFEILPARKPWVFE